TMLASGWDFNFSAGLDAKLHITQNLTVDLAINPDFAQVEADQVILNLTNFEIQFPEKRPFFLEGIDAFATPISVLYTRRIGRAPDAPYLRLDAPYAEQLVDLPGPSPIYAAAKMIGTVGSRLTVAVLSALTGPNRVSALVAGGAQLPRVADAMTLHDVARLKLSVAPNTDLGVIATSSHRFETPGLYPQIR